jgi:meiotic recombination protein REC8
MDLDLPVYGDDLPEGEAFTTATQHASGGHSEPVESSSTAAAPMRRKKRTAKLIEADLNQELRNKDLADWNNNYLKNMKEASRLKALHRTAGQAKKNAEYWVWGAGIGGLGIRLPGAIGPTPWDQFYGDNLFELYTGLNRKTLTGRKRDRDSGIDEETQGESRRVRHKLNEDEQQIGRADEDEGMFMYGDEEVEMPREAPSALDDQQLFSAMPWNISASVRGSSAVPQSGRAGMVGSVGRSTGLQGSLQHRAGRTVSASPLHGRGHSGGLEALRSLEGDDEFGSFGPADYGLPFGPSSDGVLMEPELNLGPSTRVREALSAEGENFLTFVTDAIAEKRNRLQAGLDPMADVLQADAAADVDEVLFEEVLPPTENNRMVACQGLMMVLALGTKGMLNVRQHEAFGEIGLALTDKAKDMQAKANEDEEKENAEGEENMEDAEEDGLEEQVVVEIGSEAEDDGADSLYDG